MKYKHHICELQGSGLGLSTTKPQEVAKIIQEPVIPTEPPPEFEFIADPPSISAFDLYECD